MCHSHRQSSGRCSRRRNRDAAAAASRAAPAVVVTADQPLAPQVNGETYRYVNDKDTPPAYEAGPKITISDEKDIEVLNAHFDRSLHVDQPTVMRAVYGEPLTQVQGQGQQMEAEKVEPMGWWAQRRARRQEKWAARAEKCQGKRRQCC